MYHFRAVQLYYYNLILTGDGVGGLSGLNDDTHNALLLLLCISHRHLTYYTLIFFVTAAVTAV